MQQTRRDLSLVEPAPGIREVTGTVVVSQESRFRIQLDDGRSLLFTLAADAGPSLEEMDAWAAAGRMVHVHFRSREAYNPVAERVYLV